MNDKPHCSLRDKCYYWNDCMGHSIYCLVNYNAHKAILKENDEKIFEKLREINESPIRA